MKIHSILRKLLFTLAHYILNWNAELQALSEIWYMRVCAAFPLARLDHARFGDKSWNPLEEFISESDTALLKPNLVKEFHPRDPNGWVYVLTHGSVIRGVADYLFKTLNGSGMVILGDAPQTDSSFNKMVDVLGLHEIEEHYQERGLSFSSADFRKEEWTNGTARLRTCG